MKFLVLDVGGSFIKFAIIDENGKFYKKGKTPTDHRHDKDKFLDILENIYKENKEEGLSGIALSVPGAVDVEKGIVYKGGGVPCLDKVCIIEELSKRCDGIKVAVENDGKSAGLAEVWLGHAKDVQDAIVMVFGSGIGGAIIKDRKIHRGNRLVAGEISNIIVDYTRQDLLDGKPLFMNLWALKASAVALSIRVGKMKGKDFKECPGEKIYEWAAAGDEQCIEAIEDMYYSIAMQAYNFQYTYDPDIILLGGGISEQPSFLTGVQKYVDLLSQHEHQFAKPVIKACKFNNDSNLLGALYNFMQLYHII